MRARSVAQVSPYLRNGSFSLSFNWRYKPSCVSEQKRDVLWSGFFRVVTSQNKNGFLWPGFFWGDLCGHLANHNHKPQLVCGCDWFPANLLFEGFVEMIRGQKR